MHMARMAPLFVWDSVRFAIFLGHEVEDLDLYLSKMEHWAHRMFPKMVFDEVIERCDRLYKTKKLVKVCASAGRTMCI